ncbi:hypothetical protein PRECH8_15260 [Insulibacter thermoxylanivorax]|uniref:SWIM-type domain-containing protein n=1 Tax=Insulibacter thermoxylanivorax TaxID=2749268 RepID=A0A916QCI4_9BACL|nr:SWIM zinc finger family protein [Insulibacter thermoxylanivorax]GFR38230.1 hypothetical protein PRECH8_15260 [Insulibacter thermoxylanivorax]
MNIDKNEIVSLQMDMIKRFSELAMQSGWRAHQSGAVHHAERRGDAVVADVYSEQGIHHVQLHIIPFDRSSCTCGSRRYCSHMAAVFFYVYAMHERRTELFLMQHQQMRLLRNKEKANKKKQTERKSQGADARWLEQHRLILATDFIGRWRQDLEKKFAGYFQAPPHQVESFYREVMSYALQISAEWSTHVRDAYLITVQLCIFMMAENRYLAHLEGYQPTQIHSGFERLFLQCWKGYKRYMNRLDMAALASSPQAEWSREMQEWIHKAAFRTGQHAALHWLNIYRLFIRKLSEHDPSVIDKEREWLKLLRQAASPPQKQLPAAVRFAMLHLDLLAGREDAYSELIHFAAETGDLRHCFHYVEHSIHRMDWSKAEEQLLKLLPEVKQADGAVHKQYLAYWEELEPHLNLQQSDSYLTVLKLMLPYSYEPYAQYLEAAGMYREWVDLQIAADLTPYDVDRNLLLEIEQRDAGTLLPFYHQSVDKIIAEKKRESYRKAVVLLRNLQSCYARLNQEARYETYITKLAAKYKTLRAFIEELRKGHLIT